MKAHVGKHGVAPWVLKIAVEEGRKQASAQAKDVEARSWNEMIISMHQAGLSPKTIKRVHDIMVNAVLPRMEEIRTAQHGEENNTLEIMDADDWMRMYCDRHELPFFVVSDIVERAAKGEKIVNKKL